ncbi:MAG: ribokinase [Dermatophilaceae bacterium]|uniref:Ribokinase n=1 Tax=Candidatus Phosphoribacter hodrii TaxID=2953743 RepID=A0A934X713_9MICO|nr:ribokinase [Candidatus Phosphoribacter hodrii]MBP9919493.1 ribokinase [Dermatophilaceae bacterium]HOA02083.1 ribokinase [Dermatophilaceae bacterium]HOA58326.1 ribokinase [Dermatophilaceae bacterium]HOR16784.1 ribokinase [Dermatophilaceae bacterium]
MTDICVIGSLNVDVSYRMHRLPVAGETVLATDRARAFGGKGGNQAVAVAALGAEVSFVGAVGADAAGRSYLEHLRTAGIEASGVREIPGVDTGAAMILVDDLGENLIIVDPGANSRLEPQSVEGSIRAHEPTVLLAQLEVPIAALEAAVAAVDARTIVVLNPAPMPADPTLLAGVLRRVDVLVPNRRELGQFAGCEEPRNLQEVTRCLTSLPFHGTVVVTLGADGAVVAEPGRSLVHVQAKVVEPVDTSGAGDAFCGALVVGLAAGADLADAVRRAVDVASESTLVRGAQLAVSPTVP